MPRSAARSAPRPARLSPTRSPGALIGGALGAAVGYYTGCQEQGGCFVGGKQVASRNDLVYDRNDRRYYYVDRNNGRTYWENGDFRG